jgi:GyrI-like small molecule binding domain
MTTTKHTPTILERSPQPYVAIRRVVTMRTVPEIADRIPEVMGRLAALGVPPAGAPFLKYDVIYRSGQLDMEAGVAVGSGFDPAVLGGPEGSDGLRAGVLAGGRFAVVTHIGAPDGLRDATADLLDWGAAEGLAWDMSSDERAESWGLRLELYKTDPRVEPDLSRWETEIVFRLAD